MNRIRCGRGLGDSVYLQSVVRHLIETTGKRYEVCSDWPDVFLPLGDSVSVVPFTRQDVKILAHYASRKGKSTTQFEDCCWNAGIREPVELRLDWTIQTDLGRRLADSGKRIIAVQLPRNPMGRTDGFGKEVLPDCRVIQKIINELSGQATIVQVGAGDPLYQFGGIDMDLANRTTVKELIDVLYLSGGILGYCSFILAFAESFRKSAVMVWSRAGLNSKDLYIRQIAPEKIIQHPEQTKYVIDDDQDAEAIAQFLL